jgi:ribosomal protein S27AE
MVASAPPATLGLIEKEVRMKNPAHTGATAVLCQHCGSSVLTWSPDHWLAAHEQVLKCGTCGRMNATAMHRFDVAPRVLETVRPRH